MIRGKAALAASFKVSLVSVDRWCVAGVPRLSERPWTFDRRAVARWRRRRRQGTDSPERRRLLEARARLAEHRLAEMRARLLDRAEVEREEERFMASVAERMLRIPGELPAWVSAEDREKVRLAIVDALEVSGSRGRARGACKQPCLRAEGPSS